MSRREGELSDRDRITAVESRAWGRVVDGETQRGRGEYDLLTTLLQATVSVRESKARCDVLAGRGHVRESDRSTCAARPLSSLSRALCPF